MNVRTTEVCTPRTRLKLASAYRWTARTRLSKVSLKARHLLRVPSSFDTGRRPARSCCLQATFHLPSAHWNGNKRSHSNITVHGTFVTEAHIVVRTASNRYFNVTVDAATDNEGYPGVWLGYRYAISPSHRTSSHR